MNLYAQHFEESPSVFFKWLNQPGRPVEYVTQSVNNVFGYDKKVFLEAGITYDQIIHPDDLGRVVEEVAEAIRNNEIEFVHKPYRIITRNKSIRWVQNSTKIERDEGGNVTAFYGYVTDVTLLKDSYQKLAKSLSELRKKGHETQEYRRALDASYIVSISDLEGRITYVNENLTKISEYSAKELIGKPHSILRHPSVPKETYKEMWDTIQSNRVWHGMLRNKSKSGKSYFVNMTIVPIVNDSGNIEQYMAVRYDMTDYVKQHEQLRNASLRSNLNGLPNLYALIDDIDKSYCPALALVNIDGFKILNNLFGYRMGNTIITRIGEILSENLCPNGYRIYHLHADEFAVLSDGDPYTHFTETMQEVQSLLHATGFSIEEKTFPIRLTIALSNESKHSLLVSCNMAMHYARNAHERFVQYSESLDMRENYNNNLQWNGIIHEAIKNKQITPYFQPIYDVRTQKIYKFESLMRIVKNDEVFTPQLFLEIAKQANFYLDISIMMLEKTFAFIRQHPYDVSINITMEDIRNSRYTKRLFELLAEERSGGVILEIVESEGIQSFEEMNHFIEQAKSLGCKIAIDDFGTGYSNFAYLLKLNADYIKIDGSLIRNIDEDIDAEDIVRTIVSFAKKKQIEVIAEFVGNSRVLRKIKDIGIEYAQGYYIGNPEPQFNTARTVPTDSVDVSPNELVQLIYVSQPKEYVDYAAVQSILTHSHRKNRENNVTGVLIYDGQYFIQCIEGYSEYVDHLFSSIRNDPRHYNVSLIERKPVEKRTFSDWGMSHIGYYVYTYVIPTLIGQKTFNPYDMDGDSLLELLERVNQIA